MIVSVEDTFARIGMELGIGVDVNDVIPTEMNKDWRWAWDMTFSVVGRQTGRRLGVLYK